MRDIKFRAWNRARGVMEGVTDLSPMPTQTDGDDFYPEMVFEQYTGLKDKNGREIYEGDIIKGYDWQGVSEVTYQDGAYYPIVKADDGDLNWHPSEVEVIGNIHENRDQLDKK